MICIDIMGETCNMVHKMISKEGLTILGNCEEIFIRDVTNIVQVILRLFRIWVFMVVMGTETQDILCRVHVNLIFVINKSING